MGNSLNPLDSIASIADSVATGLDELFTSDEERERAKLLMMKELNQPHIMQAMITMEEAKHPSLFVAGWRPALGWLSVLLLAYAWVIRDVMVILLGTYNPNFDIKTLPQVEAGEMMTLVLALLGLGATRTYEKLNNVSRDNWTSRSKKNKAAKKTEEEQETRREKTADENDFSKDELKSAFEADSDDPFSMYN